MITNLCHFLFRVLSKIFGLSFSFSSDGEDAILIKYLSKIRNGNYIDIGSHQPVKHSNTFLFYLLGWQGVCIDPLPSLEKKYKFIRGRDKFINAGLISSKSKNNKELNFYYYKNNRDNSTFDPNMAQDLRVKYGREPSSVITVPKISVVEMLAATNEFFQTDNKEINLLNLDIEGFEMDILEDLFSSNAFPWVVCVEEIGQTAQTLQTGDIYKLMTSNGYILGSRTFLSSIYILENQLRHLPSDYIKLLEL